MMRLILIVAFLLYPMTARAAVDCNDANVTGLHAAAPSDPATLNYTTPSASDLVTFACVGYRNGSSKSLTTATIGGNSMSAVTTALYTGTIVGSMLFYYPNPPAGTNSVSVDWEGASPLHGDIIVFSCSGVDTTSPFRSTNQASGLSTTPSVTLSSINTGDVAIDCLLSDDGTTVTVGANQTQLSQGQSGSTTGAVSYQAGADGGVMSWTTLSDDWVIGAAAVKPTPSADPGGSVLWFN